MKVGIIVPVGDLKRFGYKHIYKCTLPTLNDFADKLVIISSSRHTTGEDFRFLDKHMYISDESTWFKKDGNSEVFDFTTINNNVNRAAAELKRIGLDIAMEVHINQYIPKNSFESLKKYLKEVIQLDKPYGWLYKKYQLENYLFYPDTAVPWILNLKYQYSYRFSSDSIITPAETVRIKSGNFTKQTAYAIVDVIGAHTFEDAKNHYAFMNQAKINLHLSESKSQPFNKEMYMQYMVNKINQKVVSNELLTITGKKILSHSNKEFISNYLKENYRRSYIRKIKFLLSNS